ncbi:hypothetical protein MSAN_01174300 [Mycena sanguinolenta]|uniref:Uncharacterized protein n=1 Tax=Mycena sanguinolenta TaxID=230812 RepID=A0A8H6YLT9_9AGAR|nr:hypothetical protein MSAN_01174300 [Mycena sanguinolenta]
MLCPLFEFQRQQLCSFTSTPMFIPFFSRRARRAGSSSSSSSSSSSAGKSGTSSSSSSSSAGKSGGSSSSSSTGKSGGSSSSSSTGKSSGSSSTTGKSGSTGTTGKSSSSSSSSSSSTTRKTSSVSFGGSTKAASTYSSGGGKSITIALGQLFGGRTAGGATRNQVFGTRAYGSGYPGYYTRGVTQRGFPFWYWPLVWSGIGYETSSEYLYDTTEYGQPDNSSRPGGPMATAAFQSNSTGTTFRLVADNNTVTDLMTDIASNCSQFLTAASINATLPTPFNGTVDPEQVVQYYRASSVALTLDGYNNTAVFASENSTADVPLPTGIDTNLLECLNDTIGLAVPLINGGPRGSTPDFRLGGLLLLLLFILQ